MDAFAGRIDADDAASELAGSGLGIEDATGVERADETGNARFAGSLVNTDLAELRAVAVHRIWLLRALPEAIDEVSAIPTVSGAMLDEFARAIRARIEEDQNHARKAGVDTDGDADASQRPGFA